MPTPLMVMMIFFRAPQLTAPVHITSRIYINLGVTQYRVLTKAASMERFLDQRVKRTHFGVHVYHRLSSEKVVRLCYVTLDNVNC